MVAMTMTEAKLPEIFEACCDLAPPFDRPWTARGWAIATDRRILARTPLSALPWSVAGRLREGHPDNVRAALDLFARWRPDGRVLALPEGHEATVACIACAAAGCPACEESGWVLDRRRVRLGPGVAVAACWVATLREYGVREVEAGEGYGAPVRFAIGRIEGLLMPMIGEAR